MAVEAFEAHGEWWLPGAEDRSVFGTLKYDPDSGAKLALSQSLRSILESGDKRWRAGPSPPASR